MHLTAYKSGAFLLFNKSDEIGFKAGYEQKRAHHKNVLNIMLII